MKTEETTYHYEENNGKVVFKLGKTEKVELIDI